MSALSLVTGACGFMGSHMVEVLAEAGHRVRATDLQESFDHDDYRIGRFPSVLKRNGAEFVAADITRPETLARVLEGVEYVFHIAAIFNYSAPWETLHRINVEGTRHLLELLKGSKTFRKIILWSAGGFYKFPKGSSDLPIREDSPIEPANNYLRSKWDQERLARDFCRSHGLRFSILRPTGVYGPRAIYGGGQMILDPLRMKKLFTPKNFSFRMPTVHVGDVCRAGLFLAERPETDGEAYNLNDDSRTTVTEYFELMARLTDKPFKRLPAVPIGLMKRLLLTFAFLGRWKKRIFGGERPKFEKDSLAYFGVDFVYSNEKLKKTGFQFRYPHLVQGLEATIPWYREHFGV